MSEIKDVYKICATVVGFREMIGCTEEFDSELSDRFKEIIDAACDDFELSREELRDLPDDTELTPKAEELFDGFKKWLNAQSRDFSF